MRLNIFWLTGFFTAVMGVSSSSYAEHVIFSLPEGESYVLEISEHSLAGDAAGQLENLTGFAKKEILIVDNGRVLNHDDRLSTKEKVYWVHYAIDADEDVELIPKKTHVGYRNYYNKVTEAEKKDIKFILKTLAQKSLTSLWGYKSQLEYAGDRIDHVHPLRFLECIFTDDELKVYINNIKKRGGWVWSEFIKGFKESFHDENEIGNLKHEYLVDFVNIIKIEISLIFDIIQEQEWEELVKTLIINVPRDGDSGRYDQ